MPVAVSHQVGTSDVTPDTSWGIEFHAGFQQVLGSADHMLRNYAVFHNALLVIDIVDEEIERIDPLLQPALDLGPFCGLDDAGNDVKRPYSLCPRLVAVDIEGDTQLQQGSFRCSPVLEEFAFWKCLDALD